MYDVLVFDHRLAEHRPLDSKSELARPCSATPPATASGSRPSPTWSGSSPAGQGSDVQAS